MPTPVWRLSMLPDPTRVAFRHLKAAPTDALVKTVQDALKAATVLAEDLTEQASLVERLIAAGEARRLGRTGAIRVQSTTFDGSKIVAKISGTSDNYETRISLRPRPGHHCTCPDWDRNGKRVGPCKHVLRLGEYWRDEKVIPGLKEITDSLVGTLF
jgi:hypothetical protein